MLGLALVPLLCACPSVPPREPTPPLESEVVTGPPAWTKEPMSWQKLEMIEQWLDNSAGRRSPQLVVEARLRLAEGRLLFSRRDLEASSAPREALRVRIESAKEGFEQILADPAASAGARNRAQVGLRGAEVLLAAPGTKTVAVIKRSQWNARAPRNSNLTALKGQWSRITVHHSAESTTDPRGGSLEESSGTVRSIQKFHMDDPEHRWGDIGYHFLIDSGGRILGRRRARVAGRARRWFEQLPEHRDLPARRPREARAFRSGAQVAAGAARRPPHALPHLGGSCRTAQRVRHYPLPGPGVDGLAAQVQVRERRRNRVGEEKEEESDSEEFGREEAGQSAPPSLSPGFPPWPPPSALLFLPHGFLPIPSRRQLQRLLLQPVEVGAHHRTHQRLERHLRLPTEFRARLRGVADETSDIRGTQQVRIDIDMRAPVETDLVEGDLDELAHAVLVTRGDDVIGRRLALSMSHMART